jgi:uncharacterized protein
VSTNTILLVTAFAEGVLALLGWWLMPDHIRLSFETTQILIGLGATVPLFGFNLWLFESEAIWKERFPVLLEFKRELIIPLALALPGAPAPLVSIAAGVGEELFFRGVLQSYTGILVASILFALVHFGTAARRFMPLVVLYTGVGIYFGGLFEFTNDLSAPIIVHAAYDFSMIMTVRRLSGRKMLS